jgi:hypothetical protein
MMENLVNSARRALATVREPHTERAPSSTGQARPDLRLQLESRQSFGPVPETNTQAPLSRRSDSGGTGSLRHIPEEEEDEPETGTPSPRSIDHTGYFIGKLNMNIFMVLCTYLSTLSGSYRHLQAFHAAIPIISVLCLALLGIGPPLFFKIILPSSHPPLLPHPLPSLLLAASSWSLAYLLRRPIIQVLLYFGSPAPLPAALHALLTDTIRLASIPLLLCFVSSPEHGVQNESTNTAGHYHGPTPHSPAFILVWYLALGWSAAELVAAVTQTCTQLALYADVLIPAPVLLSGTDEALYDDVPLNPEQPDGASHRLVPQDFAGERAGQSSGRITASPIALVASGLASLSEDQLEEELDALMRLKARQELEEVYGVPVVVSL